MPESDELLFTPGTLGPLSLRNRAIRAAAFEGMAQGHEVTSDLIDYHSAVSEGGTGMTTIAYAAVSRSGLSFKHQLLLHREAVPGLRKLTDAIHRGGAAASIQIGHCGLMANRAVSGDCMAPTGKFNLYGPTVSRTMTHHDILNVVNDFGLAVTLCRESGFDAIEVHAGHGYLISQFLSPYTNRRNDEYGGTLDNRMRFLLAVIRTVLEKAGGRLAVLVKLNMNDGFERGMELAESLKVAGRLEEEGVHGLVLSGGFVSKTPMYVMRGTMPIPVMTHYMQSWWLKKSTRLFGPLLMKSFPFEENYFLQDALNFRKVLNLPLIYVGGIVSHQGIRQVLGQGFEFVQLGRALIHDPAFIGKLKRRECCVSECNHSNYCIAVMYSGKAACHRHRADLPESWKRLLDG